MAAHGHLDSARPQLDRHLRVLAQELGSDLDQRRVGTGYLEVAQENRADQLVYQDAAVLWIVEKFDDVKTTVVSLDQVRLSPTAHLLDVPASVDRHERKPNKTWGHRRINP